jgi:hypothetical protein
MTGRPVIGDVNGDGKLDVVVACGTCCGDAPDPKSGHLVALLNEGGGKLGWAAGSPRKIGPSVRKVALGDVDGDGKLDVAAALHDSYSIELLLGDGKGGFAPAPGSPIVTGEGPRPHTHDVVLADVNGDAKLDLLATHVNDSRVAVLLGDGKGGFARVAGAPTTTARGPYDALVVRDLDGDGKPTSPCHASTRTRSTCSPATARPLHAHDRRALQGRRAARLPRLRRPRPRRFSRPAHDARRRRPGRRAAQSTWGTSGTRRIERCRLQDVDRRERRGRRRRRDLCLVRAFMGLRRRRRGRRRLRRPRARRLGRRAAAPPARRRRRRLPRSDAHRPPDCHRSDYLALGDLDGDGRLDLVTAHYHHGEIGVALQRGGIAR